MMAEKMLIPAKINGMMTYRLMWKAAIVSLLGHQGQVPHGQKDGQGEKAHHGGQADGQDRSDGVAMRFMEYSTSVS